MPEALRVTLIVIGSLAGFWLLLLLVDVIFVVSYSTIFRKHKRGMSVILYTKFENMKRIYSVSKQSGVEIKPELFEVLGQIGEKDFDEPGSTIFTKSKNSLSYLKDEILFATNSHIDLKNNYEFVVSKNNIDQADYMYRSNVAMYNADVLGYNYWISFLPCRFIFKLLKFQKKEIIS